MLDSLGQFPTETAQSEPVRTPASDTRGGSLTVTQLVACSAVSEWYEAVAISQAICDELLASGDAGVRIQLGTERIWVDESGTVTVKAVRRKDGSSAIEATAELLREMLADQSVPTPLRLVLSQTAETNSLQDWASSIAYYERPNRAELIRGVYQRAVSAASRIPPEPARKPVEPPQLSPSAPATQFETRKEPRPTRTRKHAAVGAIAVAVALLAAAGVWFAQTRHASARPAIGESAAPPENARTPVDSAASLVETLASRVGIMGSETMAAPDEPPPQPAGKWIFLPGESSRTPGPPNLTLPVARSLPFMLTAQEGDLKAGELAFRDGSTSTARITYSAADHDVVPPIAVYPQFPTTFPAYITPDDFAEFEVVVTPAGGVESVRARRVPVTMAEALRVTMSLSAAKTWRFRPGLKDGEPVRYRQVIRVLKN